MSINLVNRVLQIRIAGKKKLSNLISALFAAGEQGVWYDPSDYTTMFQDSAGTTPVTAVEQPVGKILDKSGRGNHATQATSTKRPVLSARYNLLTKTEQFDDAVWTKSLTIVAANATTSPDGTLTADTATTISADGAITCAVTIPANTTTYTAAFYVKYVSGSTAVRFRSALTGGTAVANVLDINSQTGAFIASDTVYTITDVGNGWYRITMQIVNNGTNTSFNFQIYCTGGTVSTNIIAVWGASLVPADQASLPYQRVNTATDYNATGFKPYLKFDGIDDALATGSIDFTSTDKMTVWSGVRKLSDAVSFGVIAELGVRSAAERGSFTIHAPGLSGTGSYIFNVEGTSGSLGGAAYSATTFISPITNVLSCGMDIAGVGVANEVFPRVNAAVPTLTIGTNNAGTGNFGNYPLYIGSRAGTSLPLNGQLYSLIVRGAQSTTPQITSTETYVAGKTGITL